LIAKDKNPIVYNVFFNGMGMASRIIMMRALSWPPKSKAAAATVVPFWFVSIPHSSTNQPHVLSSRR
jgi:hypothetical protein